MVSADKSRLELQQVLKKYGATAFAYANDGPRERIQFRANDRVVRFDMTIRQGRVAENGGH